MELGVVDIGAGGDLLQPLAVGAIGGLVLEIPVALFLMPSLYVKADRPRARVQRHQRLEVA